MNLFFIIQNHQLSVFSMDGQEFLANLDNDLSCFLIQQHRSQAFLYLFIILLHLTNSFSLTRSLFVPYVYVSIESIDCILLSSFEPKEILLISSVKTLCLLLLNLCCVFDIDLLFLLNSFLIFFITIYVNFIFFQVVCFIFKLSCFWTVFIIFKLKFFLLHTFLFLLLFYLHYRDLLSNHKFCS